MSYKTIDELNHFDFHNAYIFELRQMNGNFCAILDNVTILPENSKNRDIRKMRTNQLSLTIQEAQISSFIEEGYKTYDANGNLKSTQPDRPIPAENYQNTLSELSDCCLYAIEQQGNTYTLSIDGEINTYLITLTGTSNIEEWDRFMNLAEDL